MTENLFPKPKRTLRQPTKDELRRQLALAGDEIIRLRGDVQRLQELADWLRLPFWRRWRIARPSLLRPAQTIPIYAATNVSRWYAEFQVQPNTSKTP